MISTASKRKVSTEQPHPKPGQSTTCLLSSDHPVRLSFLSLKESDLETGWAEFARSIISRNCPANQDPNYKRFLERFEAKAIREPDTPAVKVKRPRLRKTGTDRSVFGSDSHSSHSLT
jgi:hypothetical protein